MKYYKEKTSSRINGYLANSYVYMGQYETRTTIRLHSYNKEGQTYRPVPLRTPVFKNFVKEDHINWFQVEGMMSSDIISRMLNEFGIKNVDIRDVLTPHHVVKIDDNEDYIFVVMNGCTMNHKKQVFSEHIAFIVKENVVISLIETKSNIFEMVEENLKKNTLGVRDGESGLLLAFLLNAILVELMRTAVRVEQLLETIEAGLLSPDHTNMHHVGKQIQACRHAYLILRKNSYPLKEDFPKLIRIKESIIDEEYIALFDDLFDQLKYVIQTLENCKELLPSLVDLYASNNDLKMNKIMKRLTVVSTLFIPITFLVGFWGMNFKYMPELEWKYGYLIGLGLILVTGIATWLFMKKNKWI
ncbi:magnesium and cobalt transport protein CorA [Parabacteroides sp. OttesenSCG-928-K15]|nr:magnesium and cobalt transport protein CorA [Parabacteroides sp. OttesenSCG-928-K15]